MITDKATDEILSSPWSDEVFNPTRAQLEADSELQAEQDAELGIADQRAIEQALAAQLRQVRRVGAEQKALARKALRISRGQRRLLKQQLSARRRMERKLKDLAHEQLEWAALAD